MKQIKVTNIVKFSVLLMLVAGKKHGYEILKDLELQFGRRMSASHVYPFLQSLRTHGLVGRKNVGKRKEYALTPEGRLFCRQFFRKSAELMKRAIAPTLSSCAHCGCKLFGRGFEKIIRKQKKAFCCRYCAEAYRI